MRRILALAALAGVLGLGTIARADDVATIVVRPRTTDVIKATIHVGHRADVAVVGDGDTDLDLYVYDPYGRRWRTTTMRPITATSGSAPG